MKSKPWVQVRYHFNDPWLHYGEIINGKERANEHLSLEPIKPKYVASVIEVLLSTYGNPKEKFKTMNIEFTESNKIVEINNALLPPVSS